MDKVRVEIEFEVFGADWLESWLTGNCRRGGVHLTDSENFLRTQKAGKVISVVKGESK